MTEQLPVLAKPHHLAVTVIRSNSLIARGLGLIQSGVYALDIADRDAFYRKARDGYNRITVDGSSSGWGDIWTPDELVELRSACETFQRLADAGYGKAYFPLFIFYDGGQGIPEDKERTQHYAKMAFDWCFDNQLQNDPEIWNDFGTLYRLGKGTETVFNSDDETYSDGEPDTAEIMQAGITLAGYHVERGARSFAAFTKAMLDDLGEAAHPYLRSWYEAVRHYPEFDATGMSAPMKAGAETIFVPDYEQAFGWYRQAAEAGCAAAMFNLCGMYEGGYGVEEDFDEVLFWQTKAAQVGHIHAQYGLGIQHEHGNELVDQDYEKAFYWYLQAAERGHWKAAISVARMSWDSHDFPEGDELAFDWYLKQAEQGLAWAQWFLGDAYHHGRGLEHDDVKAAHWFRRAATQGESKAQWQLGLMYWDIPFETLEEGKHGRGYDFNQARDWLKLAAEDGMPEAQYDLACLLIEMGEEEDSWRWMEAASDQGFGPAQLTRAEHIVEDYLTEDERESLVEQAVDWYIDHAERGEARRQFEYAVMHIRGDIPGASRETGMYWLRESAEQGERNACVELGINLLQESKNEESTQEAILWLERGSELGSSRAFEKLGDLYLLGHAGGFNDKQYSKQLIQPNKHLAVEWYERGIASGWRAIAYKLGCLYLNGKHLMKDCDLAKKWLVRAIELGCENSLITLGALYISGSAVWCERKNDDLKEFREYLDKLTPERQKEVRAEILRRLDGARWNR